MILSAEILQNLKKRGGFMGKKRKVQEGFPDYVLNWPYMMAVIPFYDEKYRTWSRVYYFNGEEEVYPCSCEQILEDIAMALRTSLNVVRSRSVMLSDWNRWGDMRKVPLALANGFTLVPVKCRTELVRNSGTLGYVVYEYVKDICTVSRGECEICFLDEKQSIMVKQQSSGLEYQMELAVSMKQAFDVERQYWAYEIAIARKQIQNYIEKTQYV